MPQLTVRHSARIEAQSPIAQEIGITYIAPFFWRSAANDARGRLVYSVTSAIQTVAASNSKQSMSQTLSLVAVPVGAILPLCPMQ